MTSDPAVRTPGRPRRFDPDTERRLIVDAAAKLLRENDYEDVSVGAILDESGLSTRSFYRHFNSKDELLIALYRQNAVQTADLLAVRTASAPGPREGLEVWVDEILGFRYDARMARQVAIFTAPSARRAVGYADAERAAVELLIAPLIDVLEAGRDDGTFSLTVPERDARSIHALVWDVMRWGPPTISRTAAVQQVLRFAVPGLGAPAAG
jgi:AcrR family transcriptional regulator